MLILKNILIFLIFLKYFLEEYKNNFAQLTKKMIRNFFQTIELNFV